MPLDPQAVGGDKNVVGGVTYPSTPYEESQLNSSVRTASSGTLLPEKQAGGLCGAPSPGEPAPAPQDPLAAKIRHYYPRSCHALIERVRGAMLAVKPDATAAEMADAIRVSSDQRTPELFRYTAPYFLIHDPLPPPPPPKDPPCFLCDDHGWFVTAENVAEWCGCKATAKVRENDPGWVDQINRTIQSENGRNGSGPTA